MDFVVISDLFLSVLRILGMSTLKFHLKILLLVNRVSWPLARTVGLMLRQAFGKYHHGCQKDRISSA